MTDNILIFDERVIESLEDSITNLLEIIEEHTPELYYQNSDVALIDDFGKLVEGEMTEQEFLESIGCRAQQIHKRFKK